MSVLAIRGSHRSIVGTAAPLDVLPVPTSVDPSSISIRPDPGGVTFQFTSALPVLTTTDTEVAPLVSTCRDPPGVPSLHFLISCTTVAGAYKRVVLAPPIVVRNRSRMALTCTIKSSSGLTDTANIVSGDSHAVHGVPRASEPTLILDGRDFLPSSPVRLGLRGRAQLMSTQVCVSGVWCRRVLTWPVWVADGGFAHSCRPVCVSVRVGRVPCGARDACTAGDGVLVPLVGGPHRPCPQVWPP